MTPDDMTQAGLELLAKVLETSERYDAINGAIDLATQGLCIERPVVSAIDDGLRYAILDHIDRLLGLPGSGLSAYFLDERSTVSDQGVVVWNEGQEFPLDTIDDLKAYVAFAVKHGVSTEERSEWVLSPSALADQD